MTADSSRTQSARPILRGRTIVYLARALVWLILAILIVVAGVMETPLGIGVLLLHFAAVIWSLIQLRRGSEPSLTWGIIDVVSPAVVGALAGYDPSWVHLLIAAQVGAAFLAPRPRYAWAIGVAGFLAVVLGLVAAPLGSPITFSERGYAVISNGAAVTGLILGSVMTYILSSRMWQARKRLATAAQTERVNSETQRRFISMVSHELRTPLTGIQGFAELLGSRSELSENELDQFVTAIQQQSSHLSRLVDDILVVLKAEAGYLEISAEQIDISEILRHVQSTVRVGPPKSLMIVADRETWISGDPDRVFQIFRNLIENANKYGGDEIRVKVTRSEDRVRVQVWDDGPGIPGALIEAAFSEYVQVHDPADSEQSGFGLGLSIVKKLADAMGASVEYRLPVGDSGGFLVEFLASERTEEHALGVVGD